MVKINEASIMSKLEKAMESPRLQEMFMAKAVEGTEKFTNVLKNTVASSAGGNYSGGELGPTAIMAASNISASSPKKITFDRIQSEVNFSGDLSRPSLDPRNYAGIGNIIALLNNGYNASNLVSGMWHGHPKVSLPNRAGANFVGESVRVFTDGYARQYGICDIEINSIFK